MVSHDIAPTPARDAGWDPGVSSALVLLITGLGARLASVGLRPVPRAVSVHLLRSRELAMHQAEIFKVAPAVVNDCGNRPGIILIDYMRFYYERIVQFAYECASKNITIEAVSIF